MPQCSHSSSAMCGAKGDEHSHERFDGFFQDSNGARANQRRRYWRSVHVVRNGRAFGPAAEGVQLVDELHHRGNRRVQMDARIEISRHALDRLVRFPPKRAFRFVELDVRRRGIPLAADGIAQLVDEPPDARQKAEAAFEPRIGPLNFLFRRRDEHDVQAQRVRAELLDHVVGIDDVALRLRHHLAGVEHHALRQQPREGLVETVMPRSRNTRVKKRE